MYSILFYKHVISANNKVFIYLSDDHSLFKNLLY